MFMRMRWQMVHSGKRGGVAALQGRKGVLEYLIFVSTMTLP